MPEYLTPGVYLEETSFRSKSIEGVATSTVGMAGRTQYGPVPYVAGDLTMVPGPVLVTSPTEYERAFGGLSIGGRECQLALAARAFFANGGRRLYVSRVFPFTMTTGPAPVINVARDFAVLPVPAQGNTPVARWNARWPGSVGSSIKVTVQLRRSRNVLIGGRLTGVRPGAAVETVPGSAAPPANSAPPVAANVRIVADDGQGRLGYRAANGGFEAAPANGQAFHLTLDVTVATGADRADVYSGMELDKEHPRSVFNVLEAEDPPDEFSLIWLQELPRPQPTPPGQLLTALLTGPDGAYLTGGGDGGQLTPEALLGDQADPDDYRRPATGLEALGEVEDIAIVAQPDTVELDRAQQK